MRNGMRAYVSDQSRRRDGTSPPAPMVIRVASLRTSGCLYPVTAPEPKDTKRVMLTPDGKRVKRCWTDGEKTYWDSELVRGIKQDDDTYKIVDMEAVDEARRSELDLNVMNCTVHRMDDTDGQLWPDSSKKSFVFYPTESDTENVLTARALVPAAERFVIMSHFNLQNHEGVYRLRSWRNRLVVQPQIYTNALNPHDPDGMAMPDEAEAKVIEFIDSLAEPFEPDAYRNQTLDRVRAAQAADAGSEDAQRVIERAKPVVDFLSVLDNALARMGE